MVVVFGYQIATVPQVMKLPFWYDGRHWDYVKLDCDHAHCQACSSVTPSV